MTVMLNYIFLIFLSILITKFVADHCFACELDVCYSCDLFPKRNMFLQTINNETRVIISSTKIDYNQYVNQSIKMIIDNEFVIFYNCPNSQKYNFYNLNDYYPYLIISYERNFTFLTDTGDTVDNAFQKCLQNFCRTSPDSKLECNDNDIRVLNFEFDKIVSPRCIDSITCAIINSQNLEDINNSLFLDYISNVVSLKLNTSKNAERVECNLFRHLHLLRLIEITRIDQVNAKCFFNFNRNLVKVAYDTGVVWNMCNGKLETVDKCKNDNDLTMDYSSIEVYETRSIIMIIIGFQILMLPFCIYVTCIIYYYFKEMSSLRRVHTVHNLHRVNEFESNSWV